MIIPELLQDLGGQLERVNGQGWNFKSTRGERGGYTKKDHSTRARNLNQEELELRNMLEDNFRD